MHSDKELFRKESLQKLKQVKTKSYAKDFFIRNSILSLIKKFNPKSILLFSPLDIEPDIKKLIKTLKKNHKKLYLPFMDEVSFKMVEFRPPLIKGRFGIYEPKDSKKNIKKVDLVLLPIVGIDPLFARIGFGKGMYDRFFQRLRVRPITLFTQRELCYSKKIISHDYDVVGDYLITYKTILKRKGNIYDRVYGTRGCFGYFGSSRVILRDQKSK